MIKYRLKGYDWTGESWLSGRYYDTKEAARVVASFLSERYPEFEYAVVEVEVED